MYWMASPTVTIFSASSSGIWMSKCSSRAMTSSTVSRESAPRSSMNFAAGVTSSSSTPSCSMMISFTLSSTDFAMNPLRMGKLTRDSHVEAAVDVEDLPRHIGSPVSGQESYHFRYLTGGSDTLERHLRQERIARVDGKCGRHVGLDEPRRNGIDENAPMRKLARSGFRQSDEARLRRGVVGLPRVAHGTGGGGDIDDAPAGLRAHHRLAGGARHQKSAFEICLDHAIPILVLHSDEQTITRDAGVVDENVETSEALARGVHETFGVLATSGVGDEARGRSAVLHELLQRDVQPIGVAAGNDDARTALEHPRRDGEPDAARAPRHDGDLARQTHDMPASALSRPAGSSTAKPRASSTMRFVSAVNTRPGPTSTNAVAPSAVRRCTHAVQRTGLATWRSRNGTTSLAVRVTPPSTLRTTGIVGSPTAAPASAAASRSAAGFISEQ